MTAVDWGRYRQCPVCKAATGESCAYMTGQSFEPIRALAEQPHSTRQLRTGYARTGVDRG